MADAMTRKEAVAAWRQAQANHATLKGKQKAARKALGARLATENTFGPVRQ